MKIFISYSHKNEEWKNRLEEELKVFELEGNLDIWSDRKIQTGADWFNEIQDAIERSNIAILLISKSFIISDFIRTKEIPQILRKKERQVDFKVFPIIIEPCNWQEVHWLTGIQVQPKDGTPLESFSDYEKKCHLSDLGKKINSIFPISLKQLNEIKRILKDVETPSIQILQSIYKNIFSETHELLEIPKTKIDNKKLYLFHLLDRLALLGKNVNDYVQQIPIINFVIQVKVHVNDEYINKNILEWAFKVGENFDFSQQDIEKIISKDIEKRVNKNQSLILESETMSYLLIQIEEKKDESKFSVQAWFYKDKDKIVTLPRPSEFHNDEDIIDLENNLFELSEIPYVIDNLLDNITFYLVNPKQLIGIDLFLALDQIHLEVDHWAADIGDEPIAARYPMVVRVKERYNNKNKKLHRFFKYYWDPQVLVKEPNDCVLWLNSPDIKGLKTDLKEGKIFFVLNFVPEKEFLKQLIKLGVPFILWPRMIFNEKEIKDLKKLICCQYVEKVPEILFNERYRLMDFSIDNKYITNHISLLWDNYERPLPASNFVNNARSL